MIRGIWHRRRRGYFFGYVTGGGGAEMLLAVTGEKPEVIGPAVLRDYELRVQHLPEITTAGINPRQILRKVWGPDFRSYVLVRKPGSQVDGTLLRLSIQARHKLDRWEMVELGWYKKEFVEVELVDTGRHVVAETQVLNDGQHAHEKPPSAHRFWLVPKGKFLKLARKAQLRRR